MRLPLPCARPPPGLLRAGRQTQMLQVGGVDLLERLGSLETTGWAGPGLLQSGGLDISYWDLHFFLLVPTVFLVTQGRPTLLTDEGDQLRQRAAFSYLTFILSIAVAQAMKTLTKVM